MKITIGITLEEEDIELARRLAVGRGLTFRGGVLGPKVRGNVASLIRQLIHEESDRVIADRVNQDLAAAGGRK